MRSNPSRLPLLPLVLAATVPLLVAACSDSGDNGAATVTATAAVTSRPAATPARTAAVTAPPALTTTEATPASSIEVQGVVGAVDVAARTIDIKPTGGAKYTKIVLSAATTIKRAGGGSLRLQDIRPSDRIIAAGRPGDDPTTLLATGVTVQAVVPGSQPGG